MKRIAFVGCSGEGLSIAKEVQTAINEQLSDFLECKLWEDSKIFALNKSALDSLMVASRKFDYGILIATADDVRRMRGKRATVPRDNVMLEMGMFLGSLGLTRAFLLVEKHTALPTDYSGVTVPYFDRQVEGSLEIAVKKVCDAIANTRKSYNLKPVPSAALALSYFDNFVQPLAKKRLKDGIDFSLRILIPNKIHDLGTYIDVHKKEFASEEISVYEAGSRPRVYKYINSNEEYWDVPTTLSTLNKLIGLVNPTQEIGFEAERQAWIDHELRNFRGTIEVLIEQCQACYNNVRVEYL